MLPDLIGVGEVRVKVGFELSISNILFRLLAACGPIWGDHTAFCLRQLARPLAGFGRSGGVIMTELFYADGSVRKGSVSGAEGAQRLAAKPCSLVAEALCKGHAVRRGAVTAYEAIGAKHYWKDWRPDHHRLLFPLNGSQANQKCETVLELLTKSR